MGDEKPGVSAHISNPSKLELGIMILHGLYGPSVARDARCLLVGHPFDTGGDGVGCVLDLRVRKEPARVFVRSPSRLVIVEPPHEMRDGLAQTISGFGSATRFLPFLQICHPSRIRLLREILEPRRVEIMECHAKTLSVLLLRQPGGRVRKIAFTAWNAESREPSFSNSRTAKSRTSRLTSFSHRMAAK